LVRVVNPGVPWWVVLPCNVLAGLALILLALNPDENLKMALLLLGRPPLPCMGQRWSSLGVNGGYHSS
jgi:hypothetical protein